MSSPNKSTIENKKPMFIPSAPLAANPMLAAGICRHETKQIAEREFYINQKNKIVGTRIICLKCGKNKFIKDVE